MLSEVDAVSKIYAEIKSIIKDIKRYRRGKNDDEIIASYMECIDHEDAERMSQQLSQIGSFLQTLDLLEVSHDARDPNLEDLAKRYIEIISW